MYAKVFRSIFDGSLYGNFEATVTFMAMLVVADRNGIVDMTATKLASTCGYPLDVVQKGIALLEQPDPLSRTPDEEGRRIKVIHSAGWGWEIVNFKKYLDMKTAEERREYFRVKKQEQRERDGQKCQNLSLDVSSVHLLDSEVDSKNKNVEKVFDHWRNVWNHPNAKLDPKRLRVIKAGLKTYSVEQLCKALTGYRKSKFHTGENKQRTVYDSITLHLRDSDHIEEGLKHAEAEEKGTWM